MRTRSIDASGRRRGRAPLAVVASGPPGPPPLALDGLSSAPAGWWNCARRDFAAYAGPLVRVQRTSDLQQQDIGTVGNDLDVAAIALFCAGTTGRVITIYDQSGNGRHLTQAVHAAQPVIYTGGAQVVLGAKPAMDFDGIGTHLQRSDACGLVGAAAYTAVVVEKADTYSASNAPYYIGTGQATGTGTGLFVLHASATSINRNGVGPCQQGFATITPAGVGLTPHYLIAGQAAGVGFGDGTLEVNGAEMTETSATGPATVLSLANEITTIGSQRYSNAAAGFINGQITAFGLWPAVLAGGDLVTVRAACASLTVPQVLALDGMSAPPNAWWNCARRDFGAYYGPLVRVQRTSDLAQQDIGYTLANELDTVALAAFCAGTTGRVITLYDQTDNARHLTHPTHAQQPIIFAAGAVTLLGLKPAMDFDGIATRLTRADACGLTGAPAYSLALVARADLYAVDRYPFHVGQTVANGSMQRQVLTYDSATAIVMRPSPATQTFGAGIANGAVLAPHYLIQSLAAGTGQGDGTLEVNGVAATETASVNPADVLTLLNERTTLGSGWFNNVPTALLDGRITAFGIWGSVLAGGDLVTVRAACASLTVTTTAFGAIGPALVHEWDPAQSPIVIDTGVASIEDLRGGKHLTQPTPARQPVLVIDGLRGSHLLADGIDDYLSNNTMALSGDLTFLCVARMVSAVGAAPHNILNFGNAAGVIQQFNAIGFRAALDDSIGQEIINDGPTDLGLHAFVLRNAVGTSRKFYKDGGAGVAGARTLGMDAITMAGVFANAVTVASFGNVELYWWGIAAPSLSLPALNLWGAWTALRFGVPWTAAT